ncbi:MAG: hypothetical protein V3U29_00375, partial [Phycisphaeraceae bacterium]
ISTTFVLSSGPIAVLLNDGVSVGVTGDIDGDGHVAVPDLLALLAAWGPTGGGCQLADFDLDGIVGVPDLLFLLANWG